MLYFLAFLLLGFTFTACSPLTPINAAFTVAEERTLKEVADDAAMKIKILDGFAEQGRGLLLPVGVDVYQSRVMLTGAVDKAEAKKQAEALTRAVKGVGEVLNEIQVTAESGMKATAADLTIETKLQAKLATANMVNSINYRWRSVRGVVYFIGLAQNREELAKVLSIAKDTEGVKDIVSHVRLKPERKAS
jgi:osmotically-inducible protein OsmY